MKRMRCSVVLASAFVAGVLQFAAPRSSSPKQAGASLSELFQSERLKMMTLPNRPILGDNLFRAVDGIWVAESKDPGKKLVFQEQVKIECHNFGSDDRKCLEIGVVLAATPASVSLEEIHTEEYDVDTWDSHGLVASYGGDIADKCRRSVLTMDFDSGAVSVSDIPTHRKGCEAFTETDAYRLVRGNYWIDTTPNNDFDKLPKK